MNHNEPPIIVGLDNRIGRRKSIQDFKTGTIRVNGEHRASAVRAADGCRSIQHAA